MRKRVIKLLTGIFGSVADAAIQSEICCRLIDAMGDHDDAVKVCRVFPYTAQADGVGSGYQIIGRATVPCGWVWESDFTPHGDCERVSWRSALAGAGHAECKSLRPDLADIQVVKEISGGVARYRTTVEALVSRLIDATEQPEFVCQPIA